MRSETKTKEWFLRDPRTRKWIRQCAACDIYERDPDKPESAPKVNFENIFSVIYLNEIGICNVYSEQLKSNHKG